MLHQGRVLRAVPDQLVDVMTRFTSRPSASLGVLVYWLLMRAGGGCGAAVQGWCCSDGIPGQAREVDVGTTTLGLVDPHFGVELA